MTHDDDNFEASETIRNKTDQFVTEIEVADNDTALNDGVPKAACRRKKSVKNTNAFVFVSIGNTPSTLSKHNTSRDSAFKSNSLQSTRSTNAVSSPMLSTTPIMASKSATLLSNKSLSSAGYNDVGVSFSRAPDGMLLRVFLPPIRYPSLPIPLPPDEFSSQGSDREYQSAVNPDDQTTNLVNNHQSNYVNLEKDKVTSTNSGSSGVVTDHEDAEPTKSNPIATIGFYDSQPPPAEAEVAMGRCKALYDYDANMYDELTIKTGKIYLKLLHPI